MLVEKYNFKTNESKMVTCNFENLMKKITNRKFEFEGKTFAIKGFTRYIGFRLSRKDKNTSGSGNQDMNLDVNSNTREVYTEIDSSEMFYKLDEKEFIEFTNVLNSLVV